MKNSYEVGEFTPPDKMNYAEVVKPYQEAFKGDPWYEVSTCIDQELPQRCAGGLSSVAIGEICSRCGLTPSQPAYDPTETVMRFEKLAATRPTSWYVERKGENVAMAAVAWCATPQTIAEEKYTDVPLMKDWMKKSFGPQDFPIIWLDEVFADKTVRGSANLTNFGAMCRGFSDELGISMLAFRTINEAMVSAARRDFKNRARVIRSDTKPLPYPRFQVPDRRDFVIINMTETQM